MVDILSVASTQSSVTVGRPKTMDTRRGESDFKDIMARQKDRPKPEVHDRSDVSNKSTESARSAQGSSSAVDNHTKDSEVSEAESVNNGSAEFASSVGSSKDNPADSSLGVPGDHDARQGSSLVNVGSEPQGDVESIAISAIAAGITEVTQLQDTTLATVKLMPITPEGLSGKVSGFQLQNLRNSPKETPLAVRLSVAELSDPKLAVSSAKLTSAEQTAVTANDLSLTSKLSLGLNVKQEGVKTKGFSLEGFGVFDSKVKSAAIESSPINSNILGNPLARAELGGGQGVYSANSIVDPALKTDLNMTFGRAQWNPAVADKVMQMSAKNLSFAEIQLDPPELGQLQVRVNMNAEAVSVSFVTANPQVREALEQGSARLRELFEAEGMNLVDVDVSGGEEQHAEGSHSNGNSIGGDTDDGELIDTVEHQMELKIDDGRLDAFA
ncbi:MAG: flagellar hook-length control protein FliK [Flavobacteriales bacterium]|jgi:flagellar hook-length control protein FliK